MKRGDGQSDFPPDEGDSGGTSSSRPEPQNNNGVSDDPVLLEAALRGDIKAFAELFENYRQRLYALCLKRLSDHSLAEDVVQEVFVRAFVSLPNYEHRNLFWQWLSTIAIRMCIDLQRSRSLTQYSEDIEAAVDADSNRNGLDAQTGSALDTVIASERRAELFQSLGVLSKRQRRIFLLFALDSWSCAEIAEAEGISVGAVHLLLFRARRKMRSLRGSEPLPAIVLPFSWLRWKSQRIEERLRPLLGVHTEGLSSACVQLICLGVLAIGLGASSYPAETLAGNEAASSDEIVLLATPSSLLQTASLPNALPNIGAPAKAPFESQQTEADPASSLVGDVINPNQNATPETTTLHSLMASPNYKSDHTILAVGSGVLFVSHDGGGTWEPKSSLLLAGANMVLPPDFPQDRRMFALGESLGLQQSDDGGEIFRVVSPARGRGLAISPSFGNGDSVLSGDSKILMGGYSVFEYDAGTEVTQPVFLSLPPTLSVGGYSSLTFSPSYQSDFTVFVSGKDATYRCKGSACEEIRLSTDGPLRFRFSPRFGQDGLAYVFTPLKLLVSNDGAKTFGQTPYPIGVPTAEYSGYVRDVAIVWDSPSDPAIFASVFEFRSPSPYPSGIYRSLDAGRSWNMTSIGLPGFSLAGGYGLGAAYKLIATPTGRLLAAGAWGGIACSVDLGETWAPRCPPEQ